MWYFCAVRDDFLTSPSLVLPLPLLRAPSLNPRYSLLCPPYPSAISPLLLASASPGILYFVETYTYVPVHIGSQCSGVNIYPVLISFMACHAFSNDLPLNIFLFLDSPGSALLFIDKMVYKAMRTTLLKETLPLPHTRNYKLLWCIYNCSN